MKKGETPVFSFFSRADVAVMDALALRAEAA
jgi:hypothetical protein